MRAARLALILMLCACRADVEGMWTGHVGGEDAILSLDQRGSAITGEVCFGQLCESIDDGELDEQSLVLSYGCSGCSLPRATLDLLLRGELEGERYEWGCTCAGDVEPCTCRARAAFSRCQGICR